LIDWAIPRTVQGIKDNVAYNPQDALGRRILELIRKRGSVTCKDIYSSLRGCNSMQAKDALFILEQSEKAVKFEVRAKNGRIVEMWTTPEKLKKALAEKAIGNDN
jgi:predicted ArsR family transcriptional regulator